MTEFVTGGGPLREIDGERAFERDLEEAVGWKVRVTPIFARQVWGALANVEWSHAEHGAISYSFRAAGDLVAAMRKDGDYNDWYCSASSGSVPDEVSEPMRKLGWTWVAG